MSSNSVPLLLFNTTSSSRTNSNSSGSNSNSSIEESIKTSALIIVLILSLTTILSLTLCLILRHFNLHLLSSSSSSTTTTAAATASSNRHSSNRVSPEILHHSVIDSLPLFTFGSVKRRPSSTTTAADCAVCLSNFETEDKLRLLPVCRHAFHSDCIDTWLHSNLTCPLCRSPIHALDSDLFKALNSAATTADDVPRDGRGGSFRLEIGSISRRRQADHERRRSYSIGSFEYIVDEESEVNVSETHRRTVSDNEVFGSVNEGDSAARETSIAEEVASGGRSWLKEYVDRLSSSVSSRAMSFRGSGRFFTGSSRRSEPVVREFDLEANRVGEEINEFFRWFSGV